MTIKDIAKKCQVSVSTVSKALNGYSDVGRETAERIRRTAETLGYAAPSRENGLRTGLTYNLGLLYFVQTAMGAGMSHAHFAEILNAFRAKADAYGYDITFISQNVGKNSKSFLEHCRFRNVDGIAVICAEFSDPEVQELFRSDLPCVTIDYVHPRVSAVLSNNQQGMRSLIARAYQLGHRRIAFIHGAPHTAPTIDRIRGYREGLQASSLPFDPALLVASDFNDMHMCGEKALALLTLPVPPTCLICPDDYSAIGALHALSMKGLQVPRDVSVCGFDGIQMGQVSSPRLTTIRQDAETMGTLCAERLIRQIEHARPDASSIDRMHIPVQLLEGETLGRAPHSV